MRAPLTLFAPTLPRSACMLESSEIFTLRVASSKKDPTPLSRFSEELDWEGTIPPEDREGFNSKIDQLLTRMGSPKRMSVVLGDPFFKIQILNIENFPRGESERKKVIFWQLRKILDGPEENFTFSYHKLGGSSTGSSLLVIACSKVLLSMIEEAFAARECKVGYVAPATVVLHNLGVDRELIPDNGGSLLINRTPAYISFLFCENGIPVYHRCKEFLTENDQYERDQRTELETRLTLAYHRQKLGGSDLNKILVRKWPESSTLPLEELAGPETRVERLGESLTDLAGGEGRSDDYLPLFALMEGKI